MKQPHLHDHESWHVRFHDLMPYRVREILLVSSPYDAFMLEEDGRLTERLFTDYSELNLSSSPRIIHAPTGARAIDLLTKRRFDLVITMVRLADMDVTAFANQVKSLYPMMPVVLLTFTEAELSQFSQGLAPVDLVFLWTGDSRILLAIIKLVEDRMNVSHDTRKAGVRVSIVVEDSIRHYSVFLSLLYAELMSQSQSLIAEGFNDLHKLMRMRARPKILLARNFEEAMTHFRRYREFLLALISDVRFPRDGKEDPAAGFALARAMREEDADLPILLQSADPANRPKAEAMGVHFVDKRSDRLLREIRWFLKDGLGFGDFVFRLPDRREVARARDMYEMEQVLTTVPEQSLDYHASRNHFSLWLMARSMFRLAQEIRPNRPADFKNLEAMRQHLIGVLRQARIQEQEGVITDFSHQRQTSPQSHFIRLSSGSLGGKARGLAFAHSLLARHDLLLRFPGLEIRTPKSVVIGTDAFDQFMEDNPQLEGVEELESDEEILRRFLHARLPDDTRRDLAIACQDLTGPVAIRSSSLLEDSHFQPFAGIYATYMLPNNHPDPTVRLKELWRAIQAVYASTYSQNARSYISGTPFRIEEEKMGVIIQKMVGQQRGNLFYPQISGVGLSYNYYPVSYQKAEDGVVLMALGLGQIIVLGGSVLQFSPSTPHILPQFTSAADFVKYSQTNFYALDMSRTTVDFLAGTESSLELLPLSVAEEDGALDVAGSVYRQEEDRIRDSLKLSGPRVVTFNNVLKWGAIPLAPALADLLRIIRRGIGCPVEIEFAVDMGDFGQSVPRGQTRNTPCLYVLQIRPQVQQVVNREIRTTGHPEEQILCRTDRALGHGQIDTIRDVVYVTSNDIDASVTPTVAEEVGRVNASLRERAAPYMLIGPGRWGTSDTRLGIPVKWKQIAGARLIVETRFNNREVEPSLGTHFFHNITTARIGYLTLNAKKSSAQQLDRQWLDQQPALVETEHVRHVHLERPLRVLLDGQSGRATVLKPAAED